MSGRFKLAFISFFFSHFYVCMYEPRKMEICLSVFAEDGEWYRALCVDHKPNDVFVVMFLDYGNLAKVNKKDIMPMTKDLMFPSNANMVYIEGNFLHKRWNFLFRKVCESTYICT